MDGVYWPAKAVEYSETWRPYARVLLDRVTADFGDRPLDAITPADVLAWWGTVMARYGVRQGNHLRPRRTAILLLDRLKAVFNFAVRAAILPNNPAIVVRKQKHEPKARRPLTPQERRALIEHAGPGLRPYVLLAQHTLARCGSLRALQEWDIDLTANEITFRGTKNGDDVTLPMTPEVRATLLPLLAGTPDRLVLPQYHSHQGVGLAFRRLCRRLGVQGLTFHGLRHDGAQALIDAGVDPLTVKAMLGHRTLTMTDHYTKLAKRRQQKAHAVAALAALAGTGNQ